MSSFDKIVKLACKPKAAAPKAKYLDPIIAATWADDGSISDVCKALVPRLREPNHIVVFKALIVLHVMIRNGSTDNVLGYLSNENSLRLKNVTSANWEGYSAPENVGHYALYLDSRIRAYRDLKHDAIRVQSDTNRDMRNSMSIDDEQPKSSSSRRGKQRNEQPATLPTRSKTIIGRKLRSMTVEKGLLRETKIVHTMIDHLVECRFYLEDLEDELNIEALRMLVKDLLILFQAGNEGVINVLEHYFEMSHVDAQDALTIYRNFCKQTEKVVEFLGVARKLQNLLNVPIPNLKHAPVSLAGALQEYLDDPNFEQNRLEYKENKKAAEGSSKKPGSTADGKNKKSPSVSFKEPTASTSSNGASGGPKEKKDVIDFFSAIEEQQSMFSPPNSAPIMNQPNPFSQMMGGQPFGQAPQITLQPTGFLVPQQTAFQASPAPNPFGNMLGVSQQPDQAPGHRPFSTFMTSNPTGLQQQVPQVALPQQPQQTGFFQPQQPGMLQQPQQQQSGLLPQQTGFLQPQATGSNPFRQSMLLPQSTGMALFANAPGSNNMNASPGMSMGQNLFAQPGAISAPSSAGPFSASTSFAPQPTSANSASSAFPSSATSSPFGARSGGPVDVPNRPQSTPLISANNNNGPPFMQGVKTHQTGTKNPFGPVVTTVPPVPPVPKQPTLMELAMGFQTGPPPAPGNSNDQAPGLNQISKAATLPATTTSPSMGGFSFANSALNPGPTDISGIASSFTGVGKKDQSAFSPTAATSNNPLQPQFTATPSSAFGSSSPSMFSSSASSPLSSQPTGGATLKPQTTGFAGLKPFKPSSSFGAALLESLPAVPSPSGTPSNGTTGGAGLGVPTSSIEPQHTATPFNSGFASKLGALNSQATGMPNGSSASGTPSFGTTSNFGSTLGGAGTGSTNGSSSTPASSIGGTTSFGSALGSQPTGAGLFGVGGGSGLNGQHTGAFGMSNFNPQTTTASPGPTSTLGVGLRPQMTGGGAANPFRASMVAPGSSSSSPSPMSFGSGPVPPVPGLPAGLGGQFGGANFGGANFGGAFGGGAFGQPGGQQQPQQQQQNQASLI